MGFFRVDPDEPTTFIRGAARLMWAALSQAFPTAITDIIAASSFDAQSGWNDLGATKSGIQVIVNNTEETFDVDQILADIESRPTGWQYAIATQLAEMTLARLQVAWEGGTVNVVGSESQMGLGGPTVYTKRRVAVIFQRSDGKLRAFVARRAQRTPLESSIDFNKTGPQQSVPLRFNCLADTSIADVTTNAIMVFDQT